MKTRCPHCQTTFKITNEQLKIHSGQVRCGNCKKLFNAFDALNQSDINDDKYKINADEVKSKNKQKIKSNLKQESTEILDFADDYKVSENANIVDNLQENLSIKEINDNIIEKNTDTNIDDVKAIKIKEDLEELERIQRSLDKINSLLDEEEVLPKLAEGLNKAKFESKSKNSEKNNDEISNENSNENSQKNSNVENTEEITAKQEIKTTIKNQNATEKILPIWFNYTIIVLLSLFLMLQIFIFFRNNIAQTFPAFQNVYRALNLSLVGNGNNIEHITIEASDLNNITNNDANLNTNFNTNAKNTTQKTILKLKIMLGNRANFNQNWPLIELNLTDTLDQSIAKYTFTPQDYLNYLIYKNVANELEHNNNLRENYKQEQILYKQYKQKLKYFQAHSEQTIELYIETNNINAAGYKLAVDYL